MVDSTLLLSVLGNLSSAPHLVHKCGEDIDMESRLWVSPDKAYCASCTVVRVGCLNVGYA